MYRRRDRDGLFALAEPRLENGQATARLNPFENALDGTSRGIEVAIRRGSARRLSGWVAYAYGNARMNDAEDGLAFPSDDDQRHTLNAVGAFRLSGTLALGAQWRHGSGLPRRGFLVQDGDTLVLGSERNQVRLPPYDRLDLRVRKVFIFGWGVFTLSGEVLNVLNRKNEYNVESTLLSVARTGQYFSGRAERVPGHAVHRSVGAVLIDEEAAPRRRSARRASRSVADIPSMPTTSRIAPRSPSSNRRRHLSKPWKRPCRRARR